MIPIRLALAIRMPRDAYYGWVINRVQNTPRPNLTDMKIKRGEFFGCRFEKRSVRH